MKIIDLHKRLDREMVKALNFEDNFSILCQHCQTFRCLKEPWVPQQELENFISIWREGIVNIPALGEREPPPTEIVLYLQIIKPEEMTKFFRKHCQDQ